VADERQGAREIMKRRVHRALVIILAAVGLWQLGGGLYIHAKAWLAQELIAASWAKTLSGDREVRPWPWADTWPVARLQLPASGTDLFVLADASGRSLAFGPGFLNGSAAPGTRGNTIIAAHRDTHFKFLRDAPIGAEVTMQDPSGDSHRYRIVGSQVIDVRHERLALDADVPTLSLVTCYPFDAVVPGGPLRYVVVAEEVVKNGV
jgi:sortase A